jgi:hypothetical protein
VKRGGDYGFPIPDFRAPLRHIPEIGNRKSEIIVNLSALVLLAAMAAHAADVPTRASRNIVVDGDGDYLLAVSGEELPRRFSRRGGRTFEAVPVVPSLLCRWAADGDECVAIPPSATRVRVDSGPAVRGDVRLFRLTNGPATPKVSARGTSYLRPRKLRPRAVDSGEWVAVALDEPWSGAVIDWQSEGRAMVRVSGGVLAPLPLHFAVTQEATDGVAVRPLVQGEPVLEQDARLVFFFETRDEQAVPAAVVAGTDGIFVAPKLPPGTYGLKLVSSLSSPELTTVSLASSTPAATAFPSGPLIHGRIVLRGASSTDGLPIINVLRHRGTEDEPAVDAAATMREVQAAQDGSFRFSVAPGRYSLRASWAGALAERDFEVASAKDDVDLGDLPLQKATTLVGRVLGVCAGGELRLIPLPTANRKAAAPFFEILRASLAADGAFSVSSVASGPWLATASCAGVRHLLEPQVLDVPPGQGTTLVVHFTAQ